ncbi:MAG TPA: C1 family peptidase [Bacteroidales bacterium]|nr:C1 family peptidase [Bacteroidales bacterium]HNY75353.1 C1 family peptidase [Bacteroidales bacterium]HPU47491.1 C1 family peptidase [Bacteroidales bacterium]
MKSKSIIFCLFFLISLINLWAQNTITDAELAKIKENAYKEFHPGIQSAIVENSIKKLSLNPQLRSQPDPYFKYQIQTGKPTDQKRSGRCWMFASMNTIRPFVIQKYNLSNFEFSYAYLFFYDQLEKANLFLHGIISTIDKPMDDRQVEWWFKNPIGDGGVWSSFVNLVNKYGLVPAEIMPETYHSNNTSEIASILSTKLREHGIMMREAYNNNKKVDLLKMKLDALSEIYRILVYAFGEPPATFSYRFVNKNNIPTEVKTYTPMSFYKEIIEINFNDFVMLMNDPTRPYYKVYEIEYDRNMVEGINWKYLNLPMNEIKALALKSLKDSMPMYFSCDVGKQLNNDIGLLDVNNYMYDTLFNMPFRMDKKQRILTFASGSSHGMNIIGVDTDANDVPIRWLIENSWGNAGYNGKLIMTDKWMDEYLFRLVVNKKYFSAETLKLLEQKPILLPSWDPMYKMDE